MLKRFSSWREDGAKTTEYSGTELALFIETLFHGFQRFSRLDIVFEPRGCRRQGQLVQGILVQPIAQLSIARSTMNQGWEDALDGTDAR